MLDINNVTLMKNGKRILNGITTTINDGETVGIIGPQGSGKRILARVLGGSIRGFKGTLSCDSKMFHKLHARDLCSTIAMYDHEIPENTDATLFEFLQTGRVLFKKMMRSYSENYRDIVEKNVQDFELHEFVYEKMYRLSDGIVARALLAHTFIRETRNVVLINPNSRLDLKGVTLLNKVISKHVINGEKIAIVSSEDLNFIAQTADRVILLINGHIEMEGGPEIISYDLIKEYFDVETVVTKNEFNGKPEVHFFPEN
jgi:iron complex transport system ATP-binding protein